MSTHTPASGSQRVRVGIVGLGAVAQAVHLPLLDRLGAQFQIAAIADLSPSLVEAIGERYRVPAAERYLGIDALLTSHAIDALIVLTSGSHGGATLAGLGRGLPVFVEKPLAYTLGEADDIAAALAKAGGANGANGAAEPPPQLQVGYMKLHDPAVGRALEFGAEANGRGPIRSIEVTVLHPTSAVQLAHARLLPPAGDVPADVIAGLKAEDDRLRSVALGAVAESVGALYSGILLGSVVHDLAIIRAFAGDPVGIDAVDVWPDDAWPPSVAVAGRLAAGGRFSIRWHFLPDYPAYREEVRVVREGSTIELEFPAPYLLHAPTSLRITEADRGARRDVSVSSYDEAFENELLAFHALVVDGTPPLSSVAEGRADIVTCQRIAARHAAQLGVEIGGEAAAGG
ncbi:MAG TPA: Gfo/Idh/MocA family oxidoreductase [Methylomirabilota bacterium]|jgi:predicted dehydrogenase|nr:Gfo/Idh/MocA family oxidoreductase [Methylomirabilota bacterium]